ncbi:chromosome condensation protein CrcB [Mycobacterium sp. ITM-2017-0098]|nr:chromosome condensation protein CrcB [Mycobacterium sp. ITM-2017-0098]
MALILGGAAGALLRYALTTTWPYPRQILMTTVLTVGVAFVIAGYLLATGPRSFLHFAVLGLCGSAASLSAYAVLTISQPMRLSLAFLTLTPVAAICGLVCGLLVARAAAR